LFTELGDIPVYDDIMGFMAKNRHKSRDDWNLIKETSGETLLGREMLKSSENRERSYSFRQIQSSEPNESVFVTQKGNVVGGGTYNVLNALAAYLRYLEGTARDDWQEYVVITLFLRVCYFFGKFQVFVLNKTIFNYEKASLYSLFSASCL
jgi:hypothetical protein